MADCIRAVLMALGEKSITKPVGHFAYEQYKAMYGVPSVKQLRSTDTPINIGAANLIRHDKYFKGASGLIVLQDVLSNSRYKIN